VGIILSTGPKETRNILLGIVLFITQTSPSGFIPLFHSVMKILGFGSEKSGFPALEKCLPYFSNPDIEENRYFYTSHTYP
jgi:hypothetical protein